MVRVTSPQYLLIEYGMVRENKERRKYHYTQIFLEVFFLFWSFDFWFVFKGFCQLESVTLRLLLYFLSLFEKRLWTIPLSQILQFFLAYTFSFLDLSEKNHRLRNYFVLTICIHQSNDRLLRKREFLPRWAEKGGTAIDHLPLTSDHQWVRRSVKYHSESNTVWLIEKGMYLIIHNKLWIFVEDRILSFSQWHEWFQHPLRVCFCWSAILQSVSFTYNCTNVDCIPVMKEVLVRRKKFYIRYPSTQEYLWNITIFTLWELFFWYLSNILESLFTMSRFCSW